MELLPLALVTVLIGAVVMLGMTVLRIRRLAREVPKDLQSFTDSNLRADAPVPFGYKCAWYVVQSESIDSVAKAFGLKRTIQANWKTGIDAAYEGLVFVSPPIEGWVFVVSTSFAKLSLESLRAKVTSSLERLSNDFGQAQFYATNRVVELHIWARAANGQVERAYGYDGEEGQTFWMEGEATLPEVNIRTEIGEHVLMEIAGEWSISPIDLDKLDLDPSLGLLA